MINSCLHKASRNTREAFSFFYFRVLLSIRNIKVFVIIRFRRISNNIYLASGLDQKIDADATPQGAFAPLKKLQVFAF